MTDLREAAQKALEALDIGYDAAKAEADQFHDAMAGYKEQRHAQMDADVQQIAQAITALRAALAEPMQEPDCWAILTPNGSKLVSPSEAQGRKSAYPLYTAPPQRLPLTEEEISKVAATFYGVQGFRVEAFARAVEAAHGIKEET